MQRYRFGDLVFSWDDPKAEQNARRHKVRFEEAATVFADPACSDLRRPRHSITEDRFLLVGHSAAGRVLLVVHGEKGDTIRIISAPAPQPEKESGTKPMREEYELKNGRPNPYAKRLGKKGRSDLVRWWAATTPNVRLLPDDIAREFPDTESTVEALRLVIKLRAVKPKKPTRKRNSA